MLGKGSVLLGSALFGAAALASSDLVTRQAGELDACPGYAASNVVDEGGRVTADLALAGTACNVYGDDLTDLKLEVEYQTGLFIPNCSFRREWQC
jgi:alpha-glucosidase